MIEHIIKPLTPLIYKFNFRSLMYQIINFSNKVMIPYGKGYRRHLLPLFLFSLLNHDDTVSP